jgi:4,5-dihydroxyphthalate decarboxylase
MAPLPLTLACGPYDRTRALADGRVPVEGVDLRYVPLDPEEIDAIYSPRAPIAAEGAGIRRLFADPRGAEQEYYRASGIFPIMHVVVIQRRLYEANRWLAQSLTKAFSQAKMLAYADLQRTAALAVTLPWVREEYEATVGLLGTDFWSYGLDANRPVLETFIRYAGEQGMISRPRPRTSCSRRKLSTV